MKRFMCLFLGIIFLLVGCTTTKLSLPETSLILEDIGTSEKLQESVDQGTAIISEDAEGYRTLVSPNNMLTIVRNPKAADYSFYNPSPMTELPNYDPDSGEMSQMDLRSSNLTILDLSQRINDLLNADFDSKTQWPDKLPDGFDPHMIMELGKNPWFRCKRIT